MAKVEIYTTRSCPYCWAALELLTEKGVAFTQIDVTGKADERAKLSEITGRHTVPQVFIGGRSIGGYDELAALDRAGTLEPLLAKD